MRLTGDYTSIDLLCNCLQASSKHHYLWGFHLRKIYLSLEQSHITKEKAWQALDSGRPLLPGNLSRFPHGQGRKDRLIESILFFPLPFWKGHEERVYLTERDGHQCIHGSAHAGMTFSESQSKRSIWETLSALTIGSNNTWSWSIWTMWVFVCGGWWAPIGFRFLKRS